MTRRTARPSSVRARQGRKVREHVPGDVRDVPAGAREAAGPEVAAHAAADRAPENVKSHAPASWTDAGGRVARVLRESRLSSLRERLVAQPMLAAALGAFGLWLIAVVLRSLFLARSYDIFIDEVTYLILSSNVAAGHGIVLSGKPFFLHPPLFFLIEGAFASVFAQGRLVIDEVQAVRFLNVALAGITSVAVFAIGSRIAGWRVGLVAFALFAIDPFVIRINSRNLLETSTMLWVVLGYLVLVRSMRGPETPLRRSNIAAIGVLFGCAVLTKEMAAFLTLLPMGIAFVTRWFIPRRSAFAIGLVAAATYSLYPLAIVAGGLGPVFFSQKLEGLLRFLGIVKTTGFVHAGGPSFVEAVIRNLDVFAMTYVVIGLGIPACVILLSSRMPVRRLLGLLGASAYALLGYSITLGTLEEQFFYFLVVPAYVSVPIAWTVVLDGARDVTPRLRSVLARTSVRTRERLRRLGAAAFAVSIAWSGTVWVELHFTRDDGYEQLLAYLQRRVPVGTAIGVTSEPMQFLLQGYVLDKVGSGEDIQRTDVDYAVVATKQIEDGYLPNGEAIYAWLVANGRRDLVIPSRTYGRIELYALRGLTTVFTEDFEERPVGKAPGTPWTGSTDGVQVIDATDGTGRALQLAAAGTELASACRPLTSRSKVDVDLDVRFDGSPTAQGSFVTLRSADTDVGSLLVRPEGLVAAGGSDVPRPLRTGAWQHLAITLLPSIDRFAWRLTDARDAGRELARGQGLLDLGTGSLDAICFGWPATGVAAGILVDNLAVRD